MDKSLRALCDALKKIVIQLKPAHHPLSCLILTGKTHEGKTALLKQSNLELFTAHADYGTEIYYNQQGIVLVLDEGWLSRNSTILSQVLKQVNRCHAALKLTGILLCMDVNALMTTEPAQVAAHHQGYTVLLDRFGQALGYRVDLAIILTKLDGLAGFCDFFQQEHESELKKPLGFSFIETTQLEKLLEQYKLKYHQLIETLGQQVIQKIHPVRSGIKRTLIREFPLQLATLYPLIQPLIKQIPLRFFRLQALYFTSAEQGGVSLDRLNKKIQHEYALSVQDHHPQSLNYRAYFIEGMFSVIQAETGYVPPKVTRQHRWIVGGMVGGMVAAMIGFGHQYFVIASGLDEASKALIAYDTMHKQGIRQATATYHLVKASAALEKLNANVRTMPMLAHLNSVLKQGASAQLTQDFLPVVLSELEHTMADAEQTPFARYQALRVYLMLHDPKHFKQDEILAWFQERWRNAVTKKKKFALLQGVLQSSVKVKLNEQLVSDTRNYLNALPTSYLYYALAKSHFDRTTQPIDVPGFVFSSHVLPAYLTKKGFDAVIQKLPEIAAQLQADNWVLARQDLSSLASLLEEAYCYEYVFWWQTFLRKVHPAQAQDYSSEEQLVQKLYTGRGFERLIDLVQAQTSPKVDGESELFNRQIASQFTTLSLVGQSSMRRLTNTLQELARFLSTLSIVHDGGKTAFDLTKSRFQGEAFANPLSRLYQQAQSLPEPISIWTKQLAGDVWSMLINDTRNYINQQWHEKVYLEYDGHIAHRYPFEVNQIQEISLYDFNHFFATHGVLNRFIQEYLTPFLDQSNPQWTLKNCDGYVLPISSEMINELIRSNVITHMFFPNSGDETQVTFSLQKLSLDPVVSSFRLTIGHTRLVDTQNANETDVTFHWPESNARLLLHSIEGQQYELEELGIWGFFKMLQKVNVLVDEQDSAHLEILFEINGNSGRYLLKTDNQINPFIPGILAGFGLTDTVV